MYEFLHRRDDQLAYKWTTPMDRDRHQADSGMKYHAYFTFWHAKMRQYDIEPGNMYNIDEKGFMLRVTSRSKRVFTRELWEQGKLQSNLQDSSREWITLLATICADGTALDPLLIF